MSGLAPATAQSNVPETRSHTAPDVARPQGPQHVAIIMDGNGRWATQRSLPRTAGHKQGIESARNAVSSCIESGIRYLTIYAFSTENWTRPKSEVSFLMDLMRRFIRQDVVELHKSGVKITIIGERSGLDAATLKLMQDAETMTMGNSILFLQVAFNYGGRQEIVRALKAGAEKIARGELHADAMTPDWVTANLDTANCPDPDLLIRTGGDMRISNFLLWQCAYTEFVFIQEHWPDFTKDVFMRCLNEFHNRERRYGGLMAKKP
jgi:undecaprenyl diphosphate synthase